MKLPQSDTQNKRTNDLTKAIISYLRTAGGYAKRINVVSRNRRRPTNTGHPDIDCMLKGKAFKIEIKKNEKDNLNPDQEKYKQEYEAAGGKIFIVYDFDVFLKEFNSFLSYKK